MPWFINDVYEPSDIAISNINHTDCPCIITGISKGEGIKLLQILIWLKKMEHYNYQEQFWSNKFTSNSNLNKKNRNYKLKIKKIYIKFGDTEIEKQKFH